MIIISKFVIIFCGIYQFFVSAFIPDEKLSHLFPVKLGHQDIQITEKLPNSTCQVSWYGEGFTILGKGCTEVPGNDSITTTNLLLYDTAVEVLKKNCFASWRSIEILNFGMNQNLTVIEIDSFYGLERLFNMSFGGNTRLTRFPEGVFRGLINLKYLLIRKNNIIEISDISPALRTQYLPNLIMLDLSLNNLKIVGANDFKPMANTSLEILKLESANITYIHPEAFITLRCLKQLSIAFNNILSVTVSSMLNQLTSQGILLDSLNIRNNRLGKKFYSLQLALSKSRLKVLDMADNDFKTHTVMKIEHLITLDMSNIPFYIFRQNIITTAYFPNLKQLILQNNGLLEVPSTIDIPNLTYLDLSRNSLSPTQKFILPKNTFCQFPKLEYLDLSWNTLKSIHKGTFDSAPNLRYLYLSSASISQIQDYVFQHQNKLIYLDLSNNLFAGIFDIGKDFFFGLENLEALDLSSSTIKSFKNINLFDNLKSLKYISLRNNVLKQLEPSIFGRFTSLERVDLRENHLKEWNEQYFKMSTNLSYINLRDNNLMTITPEMIKDFVNAKELDMSSNPIACDCYLFNTINSFFEANKDNRKIISTINYPLNRCVNSKITIYKFYQTVLSHLSCKTMGAVAIFGICFTAFSVVSLVCFLVWHFFRWDLLYYFIKAKQAVCTSARKTVTQQNSELLYDAFVSYCHKDKKFVDKLIAILEGEYKLALCVYDRDFLAGEVISEAVMSRVAASRSMILVVTQAFAESIWCRWEALIAKERQIFFKKTFPDSVIIVRHGKVNENLLTDTMKILMKTRVYLEWDSNPKKQRLFWQRLRTAIEKFRV